MLTSRERWFADVLQAGLDTRVLVEPEILVHVTPSVLAKAMPRDVLVRMFDSALTAGTLSPEAIVQTINSELLAEHVSAELIWECIVAAAERASIAKGIDAERSPGDKPAREFLRRIVESGLKTKVLTPAHLVRHADARVLVNHLPDDLTAQLIDAGLAAGRMSPDLIIDILGVEPITTHAPTNVVWECLAEVGEGLVLKDDKATAASASAPSGGGAHSAPTATGLSAVGSAPTTTGKLEVVEPDNNKAIAKRIMMDYMDDDMVSLQVTVDDPTTVGEPPPAKGDTKSKPVVEKA